MLDFPALWLLPVAMFVAYLAVLGLSSAPRLQREGFRLADYRAKRLLSPWELKVLSEVRLELPCGYHVCPQVRLADLLEIVGRDPAKRRAALNRVASKSVDFAIVDHAGAVALVIELNDRSHDRPDRIRRDQTVRAVLAHCGVPLIQVRPGGSVSV